MSDSSLRLPDGARRAGDRKRTVITAVIALLAGVVVAQMDQPQVDVQAPLLLVMVTAFALTGLSGAHPLLIAIAVALGFGLGHVGMPIDGGATGLAAMIAVSTIAS